ncbi:hypothetical protein M406DRAFT_339937 [Cryphonectria parasitica EP155]|uniref:Gylcosyl hydrolase 115 C-terminal domain-containing protein n=1 Tax=Cryphonectria parasitica (strain ATCC 38755 / EP155) TaxID=660469 RepID=A0A9P4XZP2_CRYP1|nr:uncharacterized protein M406DRAFT_339937 [Cryphonectria parasitica EP155]KAF3764304.1 hypothetical protein M406DRAFT_339937 [Cryphonectria parasitica EP155]
MRPALALLLSTATGLVAALGQKPVVAFNGSAGDFQIAGGSLSRGQIIVSENDYWGVIRAAGDLAVDFGRVTGTNYTLSTDSSSVSAAVYSFNPVNNRNNTFYSTTAPENFTGPAYSAASPSSVVIIAGTIGNNTLIDSLITSGALDVSNITGRWESFLSQLVANPAPGVSQALVIAGSDPRGTIYGLYDVSEQIGVSPWYFWADSPPRQRSTIYVPAGTSKVQGPPSVKYRGLFLNDEQPGLTNWVATNFADAFNGAAGYGPGMYAHVLELILRLRANYLWPAVWASMFEVDFAENQPLADAYEVVLGSSHTEPLMRAQNEFGNFYPGPWAYNLNNATIDEYFRYGVQRAKPYARNSLWTMGMRGTGDTAIEGLGSAAIVGMLETLVQNQQTIISQGLDGVNISTVPQMWCLYKEVQNYFFEGLQVPEDITLLWADDNWGNVRRFPLSNETSRAGGAGVYYHFDYVGDPRDYKWINTVQLTKTAEQMHMAYARGADRIWIVNVGDLKPLEVPINHFMDMAYDADLWDVYSTQDWATAWAAREFGSETASDVSSIMLQYGMMANRRKFELIEPETYSVLNYDEGDRVMAQWADLESRAQTIYDSLDASEQPAFFQMVLHPIQAGSIVNQIYIGAEKNMLYAGQKRNAANTVMMNVIALSGADANLTGYWDMMLDGKWEHILDQTHVGYDGYWQQPMRNTLPSMTYVQSQRVSLAGHVGIGVEGQNATVQGDDQWHTNSDNNLTVPVMEPYGPSTRYFEVFSRGTKNCTWTATPLANYVSLSQTTGSVSPDGSGDTRVYISVDWANAPAAPSTTTVNINVTNSCRGLDKYAYSLPLVQVPVSNHVPAPSFIAGFVESDKHVAIDAPSYQAIVPGASSGATVINGSSAGNVTYQTFKGLSRTGDAVGLIPQDTEKLTTDQAPALEYQLYLFTNTSQANVTVWISPSQNYLGDGNPLQYAIALFPAGDTPNNVTVVSPVGPSIGTNMPAGWGYAVADGVWGKTTNLTTTSFDVPQEGAYTLRIWALMPSVIVQKIIVDLGGVRPSYLGPPQSFLVGKDQLGEYNGTSVL